LAEDAVDADGASDECAGRGRRSRGVLISRRWYQVGKDELPAMVARKPITRETTKETVKTIAQGMPDRFGEPV
jgi:hypothetical protein